MIPIGCSGAANHPQGISYLPGSACAADCRLEGLSRRGVLRFALMTGIALVAMGTNAIAAGQATSEIERFAASLLSLSRSASAPFAQRFAQFAAAVDDTFDVQSILRTSVGPSWDAMSPDEQGRLFQVFREYTIASFVANFDKPRNGFQVAQERDVGTRKIVDSTIGDTKLSFVLLQTSSRWRVVDVLLDGTISRVATQRSDFRSALSHGGGPALLEALQRKLSDLSGGTVA